MGQRCHSRRWEKKAINKFEFADNQSWSEGEYNGAFKNGLRDGEGTMIYRNGDVYEGQVHLQLKTSNKFSGKMINFTEKEK